MGERESCPGEQEASPPPVLPQQHFSGLDSGDAHAFLQQGMDTEEHTSTLSSSAVPVRDTSAPSLTFV